MWGFRAVTSISDCSSCCWMRARFGSMPIAQFLRNESQPSGMRRALWRKLCAMTGLYTLSSKLPLAPPKLMATSLPNTCAASMVMASDCVGFTLPGMIELPGSFSGIVISPMPERARRGATPRRWRFFSQARARGLQRAVGEHERVLAGHGLELVGRGHEGQARQLGQARGHPARELG